MKQITTLRDGWAIQQLKSHGPLSTQQVADLSAGAGEPWLAANMPEQVHDVLVRMGRIESPSIPGKAKECLWVAEQDWAYRMQFAKPASAGRSVLHFRGLDTIVDVYLNGRKIASHESCFMPLSVDVTGQLAETNVLLLHFHSPHEWLKTLKIPPHLKDKVRALSFIRKPLEDFNSFLGAQPYFTPIGAYDHVELSVADEAELDAVDVRYTLARGYASAEIAIDANLIARQGVKPQVSAELRDPAGRKVAAGELATKARGGKLSAAGELKLKRPMLWYPRGYGQQPLYELSLTVSAGGQVRDRITRRLGFRDMKMGADLDLRINGLRVKTWGANLEPIDGATHVWNADRAKVILDHAENANCVVLRAWGPGAPWNEQLFDECDRRGILLWAEFPHTWGQYPNTKEFQALCRREAEWYVSTRKHHPSIYLWCGGNEVYMAASPAFANEKVVGLELFEKIYRDVCRKLDPGRYYHPNSPCGGAYANDPLGGDSHGYTHRWFVPGLNHPIIFTENTRFSTPLMKSMKRMVGQDFWPKGFVTLAKPPAATAAPNPTDHAIPGGPPQPDVFPPAWKDLGFTGALTPLYFGPVGEFYETLDTPEGLLYRFGASHSYWLKRNIERYRRGRAFWQARSPRRTMGHILWFFNNAFPQMASNVVDYYLEPKMAFYALRRAYQPLAISIDVDDHLYAWVINDTAKPVAGTLILQRRGSDGVKVLAELRKKVRIPAGDAQLVTDMDSWGMFSRQDVLFAQLLDAHGNVLARCNDSTNLERNQFYPPAKLTVKPDGEALVVGTDVFARCVELTGNADGDEFGWYFEDNFFDLLPGEEKRIRLLGRHRCGTVAAQSFFSPHKTCIDV